MFPTPCHISCLTCSAEDIQVGSKGITGNIYSSGYNIETNAITLIVKALESLDCITTCKIKDKPCLVCLFLKRNIRFKLFINNHTNLSFARLK